VKVGRAERAPPDRARASEAAAADSWNAASDRITQT
jgi:hypothetical protein